MRLRLRALLIGAILAGCAPLAPKGPKVTTIRHVDRATSAAASVPLVGARCKGAAAACRCRQAGDDLEKSAPPGGQKRFEVRLSADGGEAVIESETLGRFQAIGPREACFYVDVPAGSQHDVHFAARTHNVDDGVSPRLRITEYGPKGPWWYDIISFECVGPAGRCNRQGVDSWAQRTQAGRKRGRLDPCGSTTISRLRWETSGGLADRDGGTYGDVTLRFAMDVKNFTTQFAPGSTECVPK